MKLGNATITLTLLFAVALASSAFAATHTVNQVGITFDSNDITIVAGDEVEWLWSGGAHTVTSGTGLADPDIGMIFDAPLDTTNDSFSRVFTAAGDYPYFCRPHVGLGMTGIIRVTPSVPNEESTWSNVKDLYR